MRTHSFDLPYKYLGLLDVDGVTYRVVSILADGTVSLDDCAAAWRGPQRRITLSVEQIAGKLADGTATVRHSGAGVRESELWG